MRIIRGSFFRSKKTDLSKLASPAESSANSEKYTNDFVEYIELKRTLFLKMLYDYPDDERPDFKKLQNNPQELKAFANDIIAYRKKIADRIKNFLSKVDSSIRQEIETKLPGWVPPKIDPKSSVPKKIIIPEPELNGIPKDFGLIDENDEEATLIPVSFLARANQIEPFKRELDKICEYYDKLKDAEYERRFNSDPDGDSKIIRDKQKVLKPKPEKKNKDPPTRRKDFPKEFSLIEGLNDYAYQLNPGIFDEDILLGMGDLNPQNETETETETEIEFEFDYDNINPFEYPDPPLPISLEKGTNFSLAKNVEVKLTDVKGIDEIKDEINDIISMLKNPELYEDAGAKLIRGILLMGSPGTGKTLLAKALAGESGVSFIYCNGADFDKPLVGQGSKEIRLLFNIARSNQPCILFIDEIDSLLHKGRREGKYATSNDRSLINSFLGEMDGFGKRAKIFVLGATNSETDLDKAAIRPGRFDKLINVPLPDSKGREDLFKYFLSKVSVP